MFNDIVIGPVTIHMYGVMIAVGFLADPSMFWNFKNGYVVYGGVIGGILTSCIYCKVKKEAFVPYFDLVMPSVSLAQGFGRIGCLFAGCCYGRETDAWYGIVFHNSKQAPKCRRTVHLTVYFTWNYSNRYWTLCSCTEVFCKEARAE